MASLFSRNLLLGSLLLGACASHPLAPQTASSAGSTGYALGYADNVKEAAESFAAHKQQAHALSDALPARAPQPKPGEDRAQVLYVLDQADAEFVHGMACPFRPPTSLRNSWKASVCLLFL